MILLLRNGETTLTLQAQPTMLMLLHVKGLVLMLIRNVTFSCGLELVGAQGATLEDLQGMQSTTQGWNLVLTLKMVFGLMVLSS